ncbi:MAG: Ig-like domain repeat protein [Rhizobiales bacterium]|nr:Ig-like domain repeat protein [Hyphomicrobiales bacterium]
MLTDRIWGVSLARRIAGVFGCLLSKERSTSAKAASVFSALLLSALTLAFALVASPASAQSIVSVTPSPATFSGAGQTIHFTYVFNSGGYVISSLTVSDNAIPLSGASCPGPFTGATNQTTTCTASYVTTAADVGATQIQAQPKFDLDALGTPVMVTYSGVITITYSGGGPTASTTSLGASPNPSSFNQSVALTATVTGNSPTGTVTFTNGATTLGSVPVSAGTATLNTSSIPVGSHTITATYSGDAQNLTSSGTVGVTVNQASQTITFPTPANTPFTSPPPALSASASSGLTVSYASNSTGVCTVSGSSITFISGGTCSITASQTGNATYSAATPVTRTFSVTPGANTITFPGLANTPFTSAPPSLSASASSGLTVTYVSNSGGVCTVSGSTITFVSAGSCSITASQAGNGSYAAATPVTQSFTITAGVNTITFPALANTPFTSPPPALSATASSGLTVTYVSITTSNCTVSGSTITFVAAGSCSITASQAGNGNYAAATPVTQSFTITAGVNTITFPALPNTPFTSPPPALTATASSGLTVTYVSITTATCTVAGSTITFVAAGACSITASQAGNANFTAATPVTQSFTITAGVNTITFSALPNTPFTSPPPALSATASSGLTVTYVSITTATCTVAGSTITFVAAGGCSITASQAGNANYAAATPVTQSFTITAGVNTITFPALANTPFTSPPPALTATASSGLTIVYTSTTTATCTVAGSAITFVAAGSCSITASQPGNANFAAATPVVQSFSITPGTNTITFAALTDRAIGSGAFTVSATASSSLVVAFASSTPATCSVAGSSVSLLAVGQCSIVATQPGNVNFAAATPVTQSFAITKATTTVMLTASATSIMFGLPVTLTATVTGVTPTGTVTFRDGGAALATVAVAGGVASFTTKSLANGAHTFTAAYSGDINNNATTSAGVVVTVNARPDPSLDPNVRGIVHAQVTSAQRFAEAQMDNITQRLERLHDDDDPEPVSMGIGFSGPGSMPPGTSAFADTARENGGYLAYADGQRGIKSAFPAPPPAKRKGSDMPFHIWMGGAVSFGTQLQMGLYENKFTTAGVTLGIDTKLFDGLKAGIAVGFGTDQTRIGLDGTRTDARNANVAFYASYKLMSATFIDMIAGYGRGSVDSQRYVTLPGLYVMGSRNTKQLFGSLALVREERWGAWKLAPYLRLDATRLELDPYTETGSPIWALSFQKMSTQTLRGVVGLRTSYDIPMSWGMLTLLGRFEYRARMGGAYSQNLTYADLLGGPVYTITEQTLANSQMMMAVGLRAKTETLGFDFEYQLSAANSRIQSHTFRGGVRLGF